TCTTSRQRRSLVILPEFVGISPTAEVRAAGSDVRCRLPGRVRPAPPQPRVGAARLRHRGRDARRVRGRRLGGALAPGGLDSARGRSLGGDVGLGLDADALPAPRARGGAAEPLLRGLGAAAAARADPPRGCTRPPAPGPLRAPPARRLPARSAPRAARRSPRASHAAGCTRTATRPAPARRAG